LSVFRRGEYLGRRIEESEMDEGREFFETIVILRDEKFELIEQMDSTE